MPGAEGTRLERWALYPPVFVLALVLSIAQPYPELSLWGVLPVMLVAAAFPLGVALAYGVAGMPRAGGPIGLMVGLAVIYSEIEPIAFALVLASSVVLSAWAKWRAVKVPWAGQLTRAANLGSMALLAFGLVQWGARGFSVPPEWDAGPVPSLGSSGPTPPIYHLLLDGYGDPDWLTAELGCSTTLTRDLEERGFAVPAGATANYPQTLQSVTSVLAMALFDPDAAPTSRATYRAAIANSRVEAALVGRGYHVEQLLSEYSSLRLGTSDVRQVRPYVDFFAYALLPRSVFGSISKLNTGEPSRPLHALHRRQLRWTFRHAADPLSQPATFRFVHVLAPHPPFVIAADGSARVDRSSASIEDGSDWAHKHDGSVEGYADGYCEKLQWLDSELTDLVDRIVADHPDAVIVVQGDHGPGDEVDWAATELEEYHGRFGALVAVRGPDAVRAELYDGMTLVNLYPAVFRGLFGADVPALPDRSFWASWDEPEKLLEVTSELTRTLPSGGPESGGIDR
ncbi:MAG: hypothetical protein KC912_16200 [Proteobacteria bacterium]|nr:hypothetical protein [Pseudomonadota bacterium]